LKAALRWEEQTLVIDTVAVKSAMDFLGTGGAHVVAFGGIEDMQLIAYPSPEAHFIEQLRMIDKNHLEDQITVIDPVNFTRRWALTRTYERLQAIHRMVYEDCEGEERNPIVNGHFTLAPRPHRQSDSNRIEKRGFAPDEINRIRPCPDRHKQRKGTQRAPLTRPTTAPPSCTPCQTGCSKPMRRP
jgi:hypothetical protein